MGKLLKILLTTIVSLILLVIVAAVALPFIIDPNDFKPQIQAAVKDAIGRDLTIDGDLSLSVFPWIGVSTGELSLSNAKGFEDTPFAEIEASDIKVKLIPLFSKQLEVNRITLKGLMLNLAKNKQGVSNWDDLTGDKKAAEKKPSDEKDSTDKAKALGALAIGGLAIENAGVVWDDRQAGKHIELKNFNLNTDQLRFNDPIGVDLSLSLLSQEPQLTEQLAFQVDVIINESLNIISLKGLQLSSTTSGATLPGEQLQLDLSGDITTDLEQQTLTIEQLSLTSGELKLTADIKGSQIKDKPTFQGPIKIAAFNLAKQLQSMGVKLPPMKDGAALSKLALSFNLQATDKQAAINDLLVNLDDSTLKGSIGIKNFAAPATTFKLNLDAIDADRYLPPKTAEEKSKQALPSPAAITAAGATLLPVETLRSINSNGELNIGSLKVNNLKLQDISLKLNAANGLIRTQQNVKRLYQGSYSGNASINAKGRQPTLGLDETLNGIQLEPLLNDLRGESRMTGALTARATLQGRGNDVKTIKSTLNGNLDFSFKDGVIKGFNIQKMIDNIKALIEGAPLPTENKNDQTVFSSISGTAKITNGIVRNDDLTALSSRVQVFGSGNANLVNEQLDYKITGKLIKKASGDQPEKVKGIPLIINIGGTFTQPKYMLDIPAMLLEKNKEKIEKKADEILQKLDKKLGPGVSDLLKSIF